MRVNDKDGASVIGFIYLQRNECDLPSGLLRYGTRISGMNVYAVYADEDISPRTSLKIRPVWWTVNMAKIIV